MPRCVKCGDNHLSSECNKSNDTPATCALCNLPHPANYRGCQVHKDIQKFHRSTTSKTTSQAQNSKPNFFSTSNSSRDTAHQCVPNQLNSNAKPTYAHATSRKNTTLDSDTQDSTDSKSPNLTSFLNEFKLLLAPLISLLTSLINKMFSHND